MSKILLDYFFKIISINPTPAASTAYLKNACVVVSPKGGYAGDLGTPILCTTNAQIAAVTDNIEARELLNAGLSRVYVMPVADLNMADFLAAEAALNKFFTLLISSDFDDADVVATAASGNATITSYANLISGTADKIKVGTIEFTAQSGAVVEGAATFRAATSNEATAISLAAQINAHATTSLLVKARVVGAKVLIKALSGGTGGNSIALVYTNGDANVGATVSGATLTGGETNAAYATLKDAICTLISQITVAGAVTQGTESKSIVLSNGQSFDFKYNLPNILTVHLKLTITLSENNQVVVGNPDDIKQKLISNIDARYRLGKNFEPQRYYSVIDAPWASSVLLQYSFDYDAENPGPETWSNAIYDADYRDLFDVKLANIILVEA